MRKPHFILPTILLITLLISLALSACGTSIPHQTTSTSPKPLTLAGQLRQGGHVIFLRHAATNPSQQDVDAVNLSDCTQQRNLDERGRQQSHAIGAAFRQLKIPVGDVKTSLYCRYIDTATLAFKKSMATMAITRTPNLQQEALDQRISTLREMISTKPTEGTNLVIVGHESMFKEVSGQWLEEGEAAIYQPQEDGSTVLIRRIRFDNWNTITQPRRKTAAAN